MQILFFSVAVVAARDSRAMNPDCPDIDCKFDIISSNSRYAKLPN